MPEIDFFQYHVDRSLRDLRRHLWLTTALTAATFLVLVLLLIGWWLI